ncbi:MAG: sulfatase-like hydrolase/transferase [Planctomycetes bacterium]|nr:sulfatase-like hydrolase/transferase [Planctomycetota bacterium]
MRRKEPIVLAAPFLPLALLALPLACGPRAARATEPKPNIVLILADDLGVNDLSCYGRKDHSTPRLDRLAAQGLRFTSAYCAQPICSPSRAALLTGKHPARLHLTNFLPGRADAPSQRLRQPAIEGQLPLEEVTLAEILRGAGYATACIGKWHLGGEGFGPREQGFDHAYPGRAVTRPTAAEGSKGEHDLTAEAERWMEENKARPFFLYLAHNTPHIPFDSTPEDAARHKDAFHPAYAAVIEHLDACAGRIAAKLDALGLAQRTIVIFASDNGGLHVLESPGTPATHNTPFRAGKGYVYEGGLRVPLIVRWPGKVRPGAASDAPVVLTDLVPTLLEAAGLDPAKAAGPLDGASLLRLLEGGELAPRTLFWHFPNYTNQGGRPAGAARDGRWKLVESYEEGRAELYDLARDPSEGKDLAREEPGRAAELRAKLAAWRRRIGAQECAPNPELDERLHARLYIERDPSRIAAAATAREIAAAWEDWRKGMNEAVKGRRPAVTPAKGDIRLHARDARVHGDTLRYEPEPWKDTLGYWIKAGDWASWEVDVARAGRYEVEVLQGCGEGSGGAEVAVEVAGGSLAFTVQETGHFQRFVQRTIGAVELPAGKATLAVRPRSKPGPAVMDLRRVVLRPVE